MFTGVPLGRLLRREDLLRWIALYTDLDPASAASAAQSLCRDDEQSGRR